MNTFAAILLAGASAIASPSVSQAVIPVITVNVATQANEAALNAPYNAFLEKYVTDDEGVHLVDYGNVTAADKAAIKAYVRSLEQLRPSTMSENEQLAFWFNLYNAKTVEIILDNYPVNSIRQIGGGFIAKGPWKAKVVTVEGEEMSLDNIEHDTVRQQFDEPRVHYAFNCASIGCPNLKPSAWVAETLDADLDAGARAFVNHPRGISRGKGERVVASNIYNWFKKDFGGNDKSVLEHIRQYADADTLSRLDGVTKINGYQYDWSLNEPE